jgi:hypothetical protein
MFADLAVRPISCGISKADAGCVLSIQKNVISLQGTRLGTTTTKTPLRRVRPLPAKRPDQGEVVSASADWRVSIDEDSAGQFAKATDPDNDLVLGDDCDAD